MVDVFSVQMEGVERGIEDTGVGLVMLKIVIHRHDEELWANSVPSKLPLYFHHIGFFEKINA